MFEKTLVSLRKEDYDPKTHPQWREFVQRVKEAEEGAGPQEEEEEDADIVVDRVSEGEGRRENCSSLQLWPPTQVQLALKCPLTQQYLEDPVTSGCGHSYSRAAIMQHIRNSHRGGGAKCPVCNAAISAGDLKTDEKVRRLVQRELRKKGRGKDTEGVVSL